MLLKNHLDEEKCILHSVGQKLNDNLYCTGKFKKSVIRANKEALLKYECLKQNDLFSTIKGNAVSGNTVTVHARNVRSLQRQVDGIVSDNRIIMTL